MSASVCECGEGGGAMLLEQFFDYLKNEKKMAKNTLEAYRRDVLEFADFEEERGISDLRQTKGTEVVAFLLKLKNMGKRCV